MNYFLTHECSHINSEDEGNWINIASLFLLYLKRNSYLDLVVDYYLPVGEWSQVKGFQTIAV